MRRAISEGHCLCGEVPVSLFTTVSLIAIQLERLNTHLVSSWEEVCNGDTTTAATGVPGHEGDGEGEKKETQSVHITSGKTHCF